MVSYSKNALVGSFCRSLSDLLLTLTHSRTSSNIVRFIKTDCKEGVSKIEMETSFLVEFCVEPYLNQQRRFEVTSEPEQDPQGICHNQS